ncbi:hypothetical protein LCGC14_0862520 [marine sediment metagenome]|uniref:RecA family profile 2 domain-containing protein n=1 Tax=marine sediment metagenome TaxID=412755 RepID=A0A0F9SE32_9ZZZZ
MSKKDLDKKLEELEKNCGLQRKSKIYKKVERIRTGYFCFDYVLDQIKLAEGGHRIELYGKESAGKTTFATILASTYQKLGKIVVWIVSEGFDEEWAQHWGVDTDRLLRYYPEHVEDACDKIIELIPQVDLIIVDSVASIIPQAEVDKSMSEKTRGAQANAYSQFTRKLYKTIAHETTTLVCINQMRVVMGKMFGNPEDTPCGKALKHMYNTRIEFKQGKPIDKEKIINKKKETIRIGAQYKLHGFKNKLGVPKRSAFVDFYFEEGTIDNKKSLLFAGLQFNVIELSGNTYQYKKIKAVGKSKFIEILTDKDWNDIDEDIWERLK